MNLTFRPMENDDLPQVCKIEQRSAEHPWQPVHFADSLRSGYLCELVQHNGLTVGHCVMMVVCGEASILILTVNKEFQRQGIGKRLLQHMIKQALQMNCETILLEVRRSNARAFNLYLNEGFSEIGVRKNYYPMGNTREDAIVMAMELKPHNFHH